MQLTGAVAVVTGGGGGIGAALVRRFALEGPSGIVVGDIDIAAAAALAKDLGPTVLAVEADAAIEEDTVRLLEIAEEQFGQVDLFCANAGMFTPGGAELADEAWDRIWRVNVMSHVHAARHYVPRVVEQGHGYLLHTASAAGLLSNLGAAPYAVTKHAVVALAEWLSITFGDRGLTVSCLCPMGVRTAMLDFDTRDYVRPTAIEPADVAEAVIDGLAAERFLILPHPEVAGYAHHRATDPDGWLKAMRRLQGDIFG
jgi:NAD(P)-dependent dehydrogenase (short-subunit alcohol dehydrogenase family)